MFMSRVTEEVKPGWMEVSEPSRPGRTCPRQKYKWGYTNYNFERISSERGRTGQPYSARADVAAKVRLGRISQIPRTEYLKPRLMSETGGKKIEDWYSIYQIRRDILKSIGNTKSGYFEIGKPLFAGLPHIPEYLGGPTLYHSHEQPVCYPQVFARCRESIPFNQKFY